MNQQSFVCGQRIMLSKRCPIESEGVAPEPGAKGWLMEAPSPDDRYHRWSVVFDGYNHTWRIAEQFLNPASNASFG